MKTFSANLVLVCIFLVSFNEAYSDSLKVYAEYEFTSESNPGKFIIKLYKNGNLYKITRKLSDSPDETGIVSTYVDRTFLRVYVITEKDGKKIGTRSNFNDDNYIQLIIANKILFAGMPEGKSFKKFIKKNTAEIFLGKECDVYESGLSYLGASVKYYMWNGIMLKEESPGNSTIAVSLNENPDFSEDEFTVPENVEWSN